MQTTLLGLGIALILALVAALVGPIFIDWGRYRAGFEAEAARMVGLPVRIGGAIEVRVLPAPSIALRDVEVGSRAAPVFGAKGAHAELSLSALMRGEWRAAVLTIEAPEVSLALDASGRIATHSVVPAIDLNRVSIDRIVVANGNITFSDAASRTRVVLDKLAFAGDVRSLAGQVRGEGTFASAGQNWRYKLSTGRPAESGMRVRLNLEPADRPLVYDVEAAITADQNGPRYEGSVTMSRPAGVVLASGKTVANEPWKIFARAKGDARNVLFEHIEAQYGPEERSLRMTGTASLRFGASPQLDVVLSARQIDLDRAIADPTNKRLPLAALRGMGESLSDVGRVPVPVKLGFSVDIVTLSGANLQAVRGDIRSADSSWLLENFEFRAPGYTQVKLSGRVEGPQSAHEFSGPVAVESADPRALLTWFEGFERARNAIGPLKLGGDVTVGRDRVAFDKVNAAFDGKTIEGRLAYEFPRDRRPARFDAALNAPELDIDDAIAFVTSAFAGSSFVRPGAIAVTANLGRTYFAGTEARTTAIDVKLDGNSLRVEKFSVADLGGAAIDARGSIDLATTPPKGAFAVSLDAKGLDGLTAVAKHFAPELALVLQRNAATLTPARIDGSFRIDPPAVPAGARGLAKLAVNGTLGALRLTVAGDGAGDMNAPDTVDTKFRAQLASTDGALLAMLGLDRMLAADKKPANVTVSANGPLGGDLRVDVGIASDGFDAGASGTMRLFGKEQGGTLAVALSAADLRGLRGDGPALPVTLRSSLNFAGRPIRLDDLTGQIGDATVRGRIALNLDPEWRIDGRITASRVDIPAILAAATGGSAAPSGQAWSSRPFGGLPFTDISGQIQIEAPQGTLAPSLPVTRLQGAMTLSPSGITFTDVNGSVAGGVATGRAEFRTTASGMALRGSFSITNGDASKLLRNASQAPIAGWLSSQLEFEGAGSSPAALVGALRGSGTVTLENVRITALDAKAVETAMRGADRGGPVTAERVVDQVRRQLDAGTLAVAKLTAPVEISTGRARLGKLTFAPNAPELAVGASVDLVEETLDARVTLFGPAVAPGSGQRPEVSVSVKGPIASPQRTLDVSVLVGWLTLQAVDREAKKLEAEEREAERRARLDAIIRERLEKPAPSPEAAPPAPPVSGAQPGPPAARMPPPPGSDRGPPRAGVIEVAPLPVLPR